MMPIQIDDRVNQKVLPTPFITEILNEMECRPTVTILINYVIEAGGGAGISLPVNP